MEENYIIDKIFEKVNINDPNFPIGGYENCKFINCDLSGSNLSGYKFTDCEFNSCNLSLVKLAQTVFSDIKFANSKMLGFILKIVIHLAFNSVLPIAY